MVIFNKYIAVSWDLYDIEMAKNNSHNILIPHEALSEFLTIQVMSGKKDPVYIEITSPVSINPKYRCLVFSNFMESSSSELVVLPKWAMDKIGIEECSPVHLENINNLRKASYIKLRANKSNYADWECIKELLETELIKCKCISQDDKITIANVEFTILQIRDSQKIMMMDCSLFETDINIEFEIPDDIKELEQAKKERLDLAKQEIDRQRKLIEEQRKISELQELERLERLSQKVDRTLIADMYDNLFK
jgi:hypothetical protein